MATQPEHETLDIEEQLVRIRRAREESDKLSAESRKLQAEQLKLEAERIKLEGERLKIEAERLKMHTETDLMPRSMIFQAMLASAALLGAGAALARLFIR
jgi:uncharacterized protein (DUF3084 family)